MNNLEPYYNLSVRARGVNIEKFKIEADFDTLGDALDFLVYLSEVYEIVGCMISRFFRNPNKDIPF